MSVEESLPTLRAWSLRLVLFLHVGGLCMQFPIAQNLLFGRLCVERYEKDVCANLSQHTEAESAVQVAASKFLTLQTVLSDIPGAVATLMLGALSDRAGRKSVMLINCIGGLLVAIIMIFQSILPVVSLPLIVLNAITFGCSGGINTVIATAINIVTDVTPGDKRMEALSGTMVFCGLGTIIGISFSGVLPQFCTVTQIYLGLLTSQVVVVSLIYFFIDETLPSARAAGKGTAASSPAVEALASSGAGGLSGLFRFVWNSLTAGLGELMSKDQASRFYLIVTLVAGMVATSIVTGEVQLILLYTKRAPFTWSMKTYGFYMAIKTLLGIVGQVGGTALLLRVLGAPSLKNDFRIMQLGSLSGALVSVMTSLATSSRFMFFSALFVVIGAPSRTISGSIVSRLVSPDKKGAVLALGSFLNTIFTPILTIVCNWIYASTMDSYPSTVFLFMAGLLTAVFCAVRYTIWIMPESPLIGDQKSD